jgi:hypothetical protein
MDISEAVFSQQVRSDLKQAYAKADRLKAPLERYTVQLLEDSVTLPDDLRNLITRMNQEAALVD